MNCIDGRGNRQDHKAEGWLCSPEGCSIVAMCRRHAEAAIKEYLAKLKEIWAFRTFREED